MRIPNAGMLVAALVLSGLSAAPLVRSRTPRLQRRRAAGDVETAGA